MAHILYDQYTTIVILFKVLCQIVTLFNRLTVAHMLSIRHTAIVTLFNDNLLNRHTVTHAVSLTHGQIFLCYRFIYTGQLFVNFNNVDNLLQASKKLQIPAVYFRCLDFEGTLPLNEVLDWQPVWLIVWFNECMKVFLINCPCEWSDGLSYELRVNY